MARPQESQGALVVPLSAVVPAVSPAPVVLPYLRVPPERECSVVVAMVVEAVP